jgi:hypothetical protein
MLESMQVQSCARGIIQLVCWLLLPLTAVAQEPASTPAPTPPDITIEDPAAPEKPDEPKVNEPGTADTTPPDPTIVLPQNPDPLSDDPGAATYRRNGVKEEGPPPKYAYEISGPEPVPFIDRAHYSIWKTLWRSAMRMDQKFGSTADESLYQQTSGSLAPALLWDKFDGLKPRLRFQLDVPLPHLNQRLHAFIGRVNRDEFVTERSPESGAFAKQYGPVEDDETLFGIRYREPRQGGRFEADAGLRIRSPLDPFVKGSYKFMRGSSENTMYAFRETVFWQNSEKFGFTSRIDVERIIRDSWLLRWTGSGTISQRTEGVKGYTGLTLMRGLPHRRAIAAEVFTTGEFDAPVPTENYGVKLAYRRSVARDWLVMETRVSCTFPREEITQDRITNWGIGIGFEMFFGTNEFLARPVTF